MLLLLDRGHRTPGPPSNTGNNGLSLFEFQERASRQREIDEKLRNVGGLVVWL